MNRLVCRSCFAIDVQLYYIENQLLSAYQNILGKQLSSNGFQYICLFCSALMLKFMRFRDQCVNAEKHLQDVVDRNVIVTKKFFKDIKPSLKRVNELIKTETFNVDCDPCDPDLINFNDNDNSNNDCVTAFKSDDDDDDRKLIEFKNCNKSTTNFVIDKMENEINTNIVCVKNEIDKESNKKPHKRKMKKNKKVKAKEVKRKRMKISKIDDLTVRRYDNPDGRAYFEKTYDVEIIVLSKNEQLNEVCMRKLSKSYLQANFKCEQCCKGFLNEVMYRNHLNVFHDETTSQFRCEVCNIRYRCTKSLRRHESMHKLKFVCKKCQFVSRCSGQARRHFKYHAGHKYTCKFCDRSFGISTTYLSHVRLVHPAKLPSCQVCGEAFIGDVGLSQHMRRAHPEIINYKCRSCKFDFQTEEALSRHVSKKENNRCASDVSPCKHCGESFSDDESLRIHFDDAHKRHIEIHPCSLCNSFFSNLKSLERHQKVHVSIEPKRRKNQTSRDANKDTETVKKKQLLTELCEVCGKLCTQYSTLSYHKTLHAGKRPFKCVTCQKSYLTANLLKIHSRIHSGIKEYKCGVCRKGFYNWSNLKRHELIHTGERPYPCDICGKCFQQSSNMKLHVQSVHMNVPYKPRVRSRAKKSKEVDRTDKTTLKHSENNVVSELFQSALM